jgi:hypothetical protein
VIDSGIGRFLYQLARQDDVTSVLEIGTWNGRGSTYCLARGLGETTGTLITVESNLEMYRRAVAFYRDRGLPVKLIHGSSIAPEEFPPLSAFAAIEGPIPYKERWSQWYAQDLAAARSAGHRAVLGELLSRHECFDAVYLDGGEFTSYAEFQRVRPAATYIVLDDCNPALSVKNVQSRKALLRDPHWLLLVDEPADRNGWCAFKRVRPAEGASGA